MKKLILGLGLIATLNSVAKESFQITLETQDAVLNFSDVVDNTIKYVKEEDIKENKPVKPETPAIPISINSTAVIREEEY